VGFVRWIFKATLALVLALLIVVAGGIVVIALPVWVCAFAYGRQAARGSRAWWRPCHVFDGVHVADRNCLFHWTAAVCDRDTVPAAQLAKASN
jgi:hypothetical protein